MSVDAEAFEKQFEELKSYPQPDKDVEYNLNFDKKSPYIPLSRKGVS
jgi:hypothetical protein